VTGADLAFAGGLVALTWRIAVIDIAEHRIPDRLNTAIAALGLARTLYRDPSLASALLAFGGAALTLVVLLAAMRVADRIDHAAMGFGDVKFLVAASFWVGLPGSVVTFLIAGIGALLCTLATAPWRGLDLRRSIALGPLLAIGLNLVFLTAALNDSR
jgi:leader peptidase (prepilin peptidase) / N-methyltransferase